MGKVQSKALRILSDNLRRFIEATGESQAQFARRAKVDQRTVNRTVNMQNEPSLDKVEKIAKTLGFEAAWQILVPGLQPGERPSLTREQHET